LRGGWRRRAGPAVPRAGLTSPKAVAVRVVSFSWVRSFQRGLRWRRDFGLNRRVEKTLCTDRAVRYDTESNEHASLVDLDRDAGDRERLGFRAPWDQCVIRFDQTSHIQGESHGV